LQSFPYLPEHAAAWATEKLNRILYEKPASINKFFQVSHCSLKSVFLVEIEFIDNSDGIKLTRKVVGLRVAAIIIMT
jgi:hypothetical protein